MSILSTAKGVFASVTLALNVLILVSAMVPFALAKLLLPFTAVRHVTDRALNAIATEWIAAWNSHDLERILSHYVDDFEMRSPLIAERGFSASSALRGKDAIRPYWRAGLAATPPIRFELVDVYAGVNQIAIHYRSVARKYVVEVLEVDDERRIVRGSACYGPPA